MQTNTDSDGSAKKAETELWLRLVYSWDLSAGFTAIEYTLSTSKRSNKNIIKKIKSNIRRTVIRNMKS